MSDKKAYVSACPIGLFAIDEDGKIVAFKLFEKDAEKAAEKMKLFETGALEDVGGMLRDLRGRDFEAVTAQPNKCSDFLQANMRKLAKEKNFVNDDMEFNKFLGAFGAAQTKVRISVKEKRDKLIMQSVAALNDLDKILNTMSERLREWYGLHYPEYKITEHEKFAEQVAKHGSREKFEKFSRSMGMQLRDEDIQLLQEYATQLKQLYDLKKKMDKYLGKIVPEEMPNVSALLGHLLAARLLAHAGGLERLAKMPSSTVQLLGAEKALFRALKEMRNQRGRGGPPTGDAKVPRFGILFTHPDISGSPNEQRGKIARLLSAKVTIAARMDFYGKENHGAELLADYKKKLAEAR